MTDPAAPIVLNPNQRRHFEVLLARLEESLLKIDHLLSPDARRQHTLTHIDDDVPDTYREYALPILAAARRQVVDLARRLELRPRTQSRRRTIMASLRSEVVRIEDSLSRELRGYGDVHASVPQQLDPALDDIANTLSALASALAHIPRPTQAP